MTARMLVRILAAYVALLAVACVVVKSCVGLSPDRDKQDEIVASVWRKGELVERAVLAAPGDRDPRLNKALEEPGSTLVYETVLAEGPILTGSELVFSISLVAGRDGVKATLDGKTAYVTPDELLQWQAWDKGTTYAELGLSIGADVPLIKALLADRLRTSVPKIMSSARIRRVWIERSVHGTAAPPPVTADTMTADDVRNAAIDLARYLAHGQRDDGHFRYLVSAPSGRTMSGYDWPRHAGATYFLAQAASLTNDPELKAACLRAAALMRDSAIQKCHMTKCVGTDPTVEVGSSALAVIAFTEIVKTGLDPSYRPLVEEIAHFLRAQQRPDGEFMHEFDRVKVRPIDVQYPYFSGEVSLALSRAARLTGNPRDLDAAAQGVRYLSGPGWSFFGDRYYFAEEHWTCQAMEDLWDRAPDANALDFCIRWHAFNRKTQYAAGETPYDADGAFGFGPLFSPRLTPVGSRSEAAVATLAAARAARLDVKEIDALRGQLRHSLALLVRHQFRPGPTHLFADPAAVYGAMPGSPVDWQLRIDYAQHAGSAMIRWLEAEGGGAM